MYRSLLQVLQVSTQLALALAFTFAFTLPSPYLALPYFASSHHPDPPVNQSTDASERASSSSPPSLVCSALLSSCFG
ncbi:hypothetical protein BZA05DRAFT_396848 [Tricharina praecox]|uniref:uncharacterized protein n=1 Tax=Tricharina praecox TaxID=43433 RepID=UPI002220CFEA|nr:uncharacterized protein BZA05DRAFT_413448 [Tricharina praecox]XP_051339598.1 uncharacterized protein BZA05DRAFT_396848 [Tricharina praecox]KAI5841242.1 hypothetical protein BZA05DRAFT_413448 [Tricharina praecox]KAI5852108.1 hypothetical protein BZA05DRAFT_396848 [Tricharina praecox]